MNRTFLFTASCLTVSVVQAQSRTGITKKTNILLVISDDQSYPYASAYGVRSCRTPAFDEVARSGILFDRAYAASPGSAPSRASLLTGRWPWQNEEAGTHDSYFPIRYTSYPLVLEKAGYHVGYTGKGWGPGNHEAWESNPAGVAYNKVTLTPPTQGIDRFDYAANFDDFLNQRKTNQPFCFWFGCMEPHRKYETGSYTRFNHTLDEALVPSYLPDQAIVRGDLMDYVVEIEWFDQQLAKIIQRLKAIGEWDNTLIIVTSDNGMPFPRAKANCYDQGIHVPLAMAWGKQIKGNHRSNELVSLIDLAPTILEATSVAPEGMQPISGKSLFPLLQGKNKQPINRYVFAARERHSCSRYNNQGYPQRALVSDRYLFVRNLKPQRYPAGDPLCYAPDGSRKLIPAYGDIDASLSKTLLLEHQTDPLILPFFKAAVAKRSFEELYDLKVDPACMNNRIDDPSLRQTADRLRQALEQELIKTGDTRVVGKDPEVWERYPRFSFMREFPMID